MADSKARAYDFVMSFVDNSKDYKAQYIDRWQEVLANFVVDPLDFVSSSTSYPYRKDRYGNSSRGKRGIILKDAETHKAIMTYASNLVLTLLGDSRNEYIRATPTGWEDATLKAPTATKLLRYVFSINGHFRTMVEAIVDMLLFGTAIVEINWKYIEREQPVRTVESIGGIEVDSTTRQSVVAYDDVAISVVDNADFYPDPSEYRLENMSGVAKRFKINAMRARWMAESGIYGKEATERAIKNIGDQNDSDSSRQDEDFREGVDQPEDTEAQSDFVEMIGYEYWGEVPWEDDQGSSRRVITVLNKEVVRDKPYPLNDSDLPFRALTINPVVGRFYGVSPAEVIRWDQDLQDAVKILLAEAIIRQVHPPLAYDPDSDIDLAQLRAWKPDLPIAARGGPSAVGTIQYSPNVFNGFALANDLKGSMQEASGAVSALQGTGIGVNRASATEAQFTFQQATSRPELAALLLEKEAMPNIAKSILRRYQQFLDDTQALHDRVGEIPPSAWIGDIMGDFDIVFVGSRLAMNRQQKLQAYDRLAAMTAAIPQAAALVPWQQMLASIIGDVMELPEVAAMIANPKVVQQNLLLNQLAQAGPGAGNGNNTVRRSEPSGLIPAQVAGGELG